MEEGVYTECTKEFFDFLEGELVKQGHVFDRTTLSESQISDAENRYKITFHRDFKLFLQHPVSTSSEFYDYSAPLNSEGSNQILNALSGFQRGIEFDIKHNSVWNATWGSKSDEVEKKLANFRKVYTNAQKLYPIFGHRALVSNFPHSIVISVHQTDIIVYGYNLAVYLQHEFLKDAVKDPVKDSYSTIVPKISFWSQWIR